MKSYYLFPIVIFIFVVLSFSFAPLTVAITQKTLTLLLQVIIPSLLPYLLLTLLFIELGGAEIFAYIFQFIGIKLLKVSGKGLCTFIVALLAGGHVGTIVTSTFVDDNQLSINEGQRLFNISSLASPSFIFVTLYYAAINKSLYIILVCIYYLACFLILLLSYRFYPSELGNLTILNLKQELKARYQQLNFGRMIKKVIKNTTMSLLIISGTMVLFNLPLGFLTLWLQPKTALMIGGLFEFSYSSLTLVSSGSDFLTYLIILIILTGGGFSLFIQNLGVLSPKLKAKDYLITKLIQVILVSVIFLFFSS